MKTIILEVITIAVVIASGMNTLVTMAEAHAETKAKIEKELN